MSALYIDRNVKQTRMKNKKKLTYIDSLYDSQQNSLIFCDAWYVFLVGQAEPLLSVTLGGRGGRFGVRRVTEQTPNVCDGG